jgi:hypothetical protein
MVHTPVHASWLNQVEIYFSVIARKALSPNDCDDLDVVIERLAAFGTRYNQAAKPFKWKFTPTDLADLLDRLDRHRPAISTDQAQPRAAWPPTNLRAGPLSGIDLRTLNVLPLRHRRTAPSKTSLNRKPTGGC